MRKHLTKKFLYSFFFIVLSVLLFVGCSHEHSDGKWKTKKEATCTQNGQKVRECDCGEDKTEQIPSTGHDYQEEATKTGTCQENAEVTYTCKSCNDTYTEEIATTKYTATEVYELYKNSVGEIVVYDENGEELGLGTCFVYQSGDQLITNYHVIENSASAKVTIGNSSYNVAKVLAYDKTIDIAVLQLKGADFTPVTLCTLEHEVGAPVYALGNSKGLTSTFSDGMITTANREVDGVHYVQHDAPISAGNSGGPLINEFAEVVGVNTWTVRDSQNLNFAILLSELDNLDFENPLTMEEFYEKEGSPFNKMKAYIKAEGTRDGDDYSLELGREYSSSDRSMVYSWEAHYLAEDDEIALFYNAGDALGIALYLDNTLSGTYIWIYVDIYEDMMSGSVRASTFTSNSALSYDYAEAYYSTKAEILSLSASMLHLLCYEMDDMFADIGITAEDLGFSHF